MNVKVIHTERSASEVKTEVDGHSAIGQLLQNPFARHVHILYDGPDDVRRVVCYRRDDGGS